jgi:hypothetical protein
MKTSLSLFPALALALPLLAQQPTDSFPSPEQEPTPDPTPAPVQSAGIDTPTGTPLTGNTSMQQVIANWSPAAREAAKQMADRYGTPQEITANRLVWHDNRPWKTTTVINEDVPHNFPAPHADVLEQSLAIGVPVEKFTALAQFDGSITVGRTTGELTARCGTEESNYIALNLANDVINGKLTVPQARQRLVELTQAVQNGEQPAYAGGIQFSLPVSSRTGDADGPDRPRKKP